MFLMGTMNQAFWFVVVILVHGNAYGQMRLTITSDESTYVYREPIRIRACFTNEGTEEQRLLTPDWITPNMESAFWEIHLPNGEIERRKLVIAHLDRIINENWIGLPVAAGDSLIVFCYAIVSSKVEANGTLGPNDFTLREPGKHGLRLGYMVPRYYKRLWHPKGDTLRSNEISITAQDASAAEEEILDAYWSGNQFHLAVGDNYLHLEHNAPLLERIITKYPDEAPTRHVRLALARALLTQGRTDPDALEKGIRLLEELIDSEPAFRYHETRMHLSAGYVLEGKNDTALRLLCETIVRMPELIDTPTFVERLVYASVGTQTDGYRNWTNSRATGRKWQALPSEAIEMIRELRAAGETPE